MTRFSPELLRGSCCRTRANTLQDQRADVPAGHGLGSVFTLSGDSATRSGERPGVSAGGQLGILRRAEQLAERLHRHLDQQPRPNGSAFTTEGSLTASVLTSTTVPVTGA